MRINKSSRHRKRVLASSVIGFVMCAPDADSRRYILRIVGSVDATRRKRRWRKITYRIQAELASLFPRLRQARDRRRKLRRRKYRLQARRRQGGPRTRQEISPLTAETVVRWLKGHGIKRRQMKRENRRERMREKRAARGFSNISESNILAGSTRGRDAREGDPSTSAT